MKAFCNKTKCHFGSKPMQWFKATQSTVFSHSNSRANQTLCQPRKKLHPSIVGIEETRGDGKNKVK